MKIQKIEIIHVKPRWSFLKIHTDDGLIGYGEAIVEGRSRTVEMAVKEWEPILIGMDPRRIEHLWQMMYKGTHYRGGPALTSAISGIEQALWDILGKSLDVPIYQLLGGAVRDKIRMYKQVHSETPEEAFEKGKQAVAEGFTMVKTKLLNARYVESVSHINKQVAIIEALRDAIGPDNDLAIDFHGKFSPSLAIRYAKEFERFSPAFIEEPCPPENVDVMATIARATTIPVATGERLFTKWSFREILEKQAAAIVQPDIAHCGGIMEAKKIAAMAETYYAAIAPHNPIGPINLAASLQLAANVPNFLAQEHVTLGVGYLKQPFVVKGGYIDLPAGPGLGIELDDEAVEALRYEGDWFRTGTRNEDGSYNEW